MNLAKKQAYGLLLKTNQNKMILLCCENISSTAIMDWKTLIPLVSPIIVVLLFLIDRVIGFKLRKREAERNWYLKVLIEPCIQKMTTFYKETLECYKTSSTVLKNSNNLPHADYISIKSREFGKFQIIKRDTEAEIFTPIQLTYPYVGKSISENLRNIEDEFTTCLDQEKFSDEAIADFQMKLATNKAIMIKHLYSPLE